MVSISVWLGLHLIISTSRVTANIDAVVPRMTRASGQLWLERAVYIMLTFIEANAINIQSQLGILSKVPSDPLVVIFDIL